MKNTSFLKVLMSVALLFTAWSCGDSGGDAETACNNVDCSGAGVCVLANGEARCLCQAGYHEEGLHCTKNLCLENDCVHGRCKDPANSAECVCEGGYSGTACTECEPGYHWVGLECVLDGHCQSNPCLHGTCMDQEENFICLCSLGYQGELCDRCATQYHAVEDQCLPDGACDPNPCIYGSCSEFMGEAKCSCWQGYDGRYCESCAQGYKQEGLRCILKSQCDENPCVRGTCKTEGASFLCLCEEGYGGDLCDACAEGYEQNGEHCILIGVNPCEPTPCLHGECNVVSAKAECSCAKGWSGDVCNDCAEGYEKQGETCVERGDNPCKTDPCKELGRTRCEATSEGYRCLCDEGYTDISGICVADCDVDAELCTTARPSFGFMVSANGYGAVLVDLGARKIAHFYEHPYKMWGLDGQGRAANTRDLLFDSFLGIRVDGTGTWLNTQDMSYAGYYAQSGIMHWVQDVGELRVETFAYAPWTMKRPALVLLGRVTNLGQSEKNASLFTLHNYRLGNTDGPSDTEPDSAGERITRDVNNGAYKEEGPGGLLLHRPLGGVNHFGAAGSTDAGSPWQRVQSGLDLTDNQDAQEGSDRVCAFQKDLTLAPGESGWIGTVTAFDRTKNAEMTRQEVENAYGSKTPEEVLAEAVAEWEAWRKPAPDDLSATELAVYRVNEAILRMGQVWEEENKAKGQILAALPMDPGLPFESWHVAWVRDMSYAIVALARTGHFVEAREALHFMLNADSGKRKSEVGCDYQISVCRYYGKGEEETDVNENGPNIEFDGFGLFLWALSEYVQRSGDTGFADQSWDVISGKIAGALIKLVDSKNGMIKADSSIWEVHWNGKQKQFAYTSLTAARGLCSISDVAAMLGKTSEANDWATAAKNIAEAVTMHSVDGSKVLAQSVEDLERGSGYLDAAVVEAFNWGLMDPSGGIGQATFTRFASSLKVGSGRGYFRNDDGGTYDSMEWVLIDLRMAAALRAAGKGSEAERIIDWITALGNKNLGLIPELLHPQLSTYAGSVPMVGFGAGAYLIEMTSRSLPAPQPACDIAW